MNHLEIDEVRKRYERRKANVESDRYSFLNPSVWQNVQECQRAKLKLFAELGITSFNETKLIEVGCGSGGNLLEFLRWGFEPENLKGIELLEDRAAQASKVLPAGMIYCGDANRVNLPVASQDIVFQSTVFSSLLDDAFQMDLAARMWGWVKPGGGVLWYDFIYNNPNNPDVRGVPLKRVHALFPQGRFMVKRITLAPPLARNVCKFHSSLYPVFNLFPFLRTHVLCWIQKPCNDTDTS